MTEGLWILLGAPVIFFMGSAVHYLYDWTKGNFVIGLFAPINHSVWEHLKLLLVPVPFWWCLSYWFVGGSKQVESGRWFTGMVVAFLTSMITMVLVYYFYRYGLGVHKLIVDILLLLFSALAGQIISIGLYQIITPIPGVYIWSIMIIVYVFFIKVTLSPPDIPMFQSKPSVDQ